MCVHYNVGEWRLALDWLPSRRYVNQHKNDLYLTKKKNLLNVLSDLAVSF